MADIVSEEKRSWMMSRISGKNTNPELQIRKALFNRGYRYQLHRHNLPGRPDLVLPKYNTTIFINGCFWHVHSCPVFKWPKTREDFWREKLLRNKERDDNNYQQLRRLSWRILVVWECSVRGKNRCDLNLIIDEVEQFLRSETIFREIDYKVCQD